MVIPPPGNDPVSPGARRAIIYMLLTLAVFFITALTVAGLAQAACDPDLDCDTAGLAGFVWGVLVTVVVMPVVIAIGETVARSRR
jgi:quinol-cytochrome oxidoreductase complex cytochrome b subunit